MLTPFFCHDALPISVPAATTANVAVCPAVTVWFAGCVVIVGATAAAFTVSVAALLVTAPAVFVTPTRIVEPPAAVVVANVVSLGDRVPVLVTQLFSHQVPNAAVP